ncbi:hypothetical protein N7509_013087 [Penicillium cosmopolitanum]|uniref:Uncharacterized protein n=1 Tax=Penicillium cosmopolitanum TaxID=1131564 RepID=A0A9W9SCL3_9EURO|nr:uncharacterized protein N7509_013087 [Penicillium cosmopolitanum]KAJ5376201.1 hypothetical protein N7509_013087 [Penicillium cosmopolitanum]
MDSPTPNPKIAFISGPISTDPQENYLPLHYAPTIDQAVERGDHFVIGPIPSGVDAEALAYLLAWPISPDRITIFMTPSEDGMWGAKFRGFGVKVHVVEGQMPRERDAELTKASTYDICRVRTKKEGKAFYGKSWRDGFVTNTERNWKRRRGIKEDVVIEPEEINRSLEFDNVRSSAKDVKTRMGILGRWVESLRRHD